MHADTRPQTPPRRSFPLPLVHAQTVKLQEQKEMCVLGQGVVVRHSCQIFVIIDLRCSLTLSITGCHLYNLDSLPSNFSCSS